MTKPKLEPESLTYFAAPSGDGCASPSDLAVGEVVKGQPGSPARSEAARAAVAAAAAAPAPAEDDCEREGSVAPAQLQAIVDPVCSFGMEYSPEELAELVGGNESTTQLPVFVSTGAAGPVTSSGGGVGGGGQHHLLRHCLPEDARGEGALCHFGAVSVVEAAKAIKKMSQRELQAKFRAVYNSVTHSNNNNWLRRKLFEAIGLDPTKGSAKKAAAGMAPKRRRTAAGAVRARGSGGRGAAGRRAAAAARAAAATTTAVAPSPEGSWTEAGWEAPVGADDKVAEALLALGQAADMIEAEDRCTRAAMDVDCLCWHRACST